MNINIGDKIKEMRLHKGMSQNTLAKKAGIAQSTLSYIECGSKQPKFETLSSICRGLGTGVFELLAYNEKGSGKKKLEEQAAALEPTGEPAAEGIDESLYEGYLSNQN